jgi:predicted AAA+ superfamily ATPase
MESRLITLAGQFPVIVVTGPRQCGKSTMLQNMFPNTEYLTFDDAALRLSAKADPRRFVESLPKPVIIDEIQYVPEILPALKILVDSNRDNGSYFLTGSQVFNLMAHLSESLAGRAAVFELLPFSLNELPVLPAGRAAAYEQMMKGFYPLPNVQETDRSVFYGSYISTYIERDVRQIQNIRDIGTFEVFLQILAGRAGNILKIEEVARDCGISPASAKNWLSILETSRIVYLLRPYYRNSGKRLIKSPKLYFTDTGLLVYLLRYPDAGTLAAGPAAGAVFENMIVAEALKQKFWTHSTDSLYFFRDSNGVEVDLVVDKGLSYSLYEIKSTLSIRPEMAKHLSACGIGNSKKYVLSFHESPMPLPDGAEALPWNKFVL